MGANLIIKSNERSEYSYIGLGDFFLKRNILSIFSLSILIFRNFDKLK